MSFLKTPKADSYKPDYTGLQLQTSVATLPVPVGWGQFKLAPNVIWYNNFQQHKEKGGGKGLGGGGGTSYTYTADVILGLCEGPISGIDQVWDGTTVYTGLSSLGLSLFEGNAPQSGWSYLYSKYPSQALSYPGVAYLCAASYSLGSDATLPSRNFEIVGRFAGTGANGVDADPALVIQDELTNPQYSPNFPAAAINTASLLSSSAAGTTGDAAAQTYWRAVGLCFSPSYSSVETAQSILQRQGKILNTAIFMSGGLLTFVPFGDEAVTGNGVTYLPNLTPVVSLDDDDFQVDGSNDPVQCQITDPAEAYNVERITVSDRTNQYNSTPIEARDEAAVNRYGVRVDTGTSATEICDTSVGSVVAQLLLQQTLYNRNTYSFKLDARYCGLNPMDIVALTDEYLGMAGTAVRVLTVEEDDTGVLAITAQELLVGVGTAVLYARQTSTSMGVLSAFATAAPVNPPVVFEPPVALTGGVAQVWIGASGGVGGVAAPAWAGAQIWLSLDSETYSCIGDVTAPCRQGALLAALPAYAGANPDAVDTLSVDLTQSAGTLASATASAAASGATMCLVDGELLSFVTATLTAADQYALGTLYRGQFGTTTAAHAAGAQFARVDDAFFEYDLPASYVGQVIWIKLASYNAGGAGMQGLSDCIAYPYVPTGAGSIGPVTTALALGQSLDLGQVTDGVALTDDFGMTGDTSVIAVDLGVLT